MLIVTNSDLSVFPFGQTIIYKRCARERGVVEFTSSDWTCSSIQLQMLEKTTHVFSPDLKLEHNAIIPELFLK